MPKQSLVVSAAEEQSAVAEEINRNIINISTAADHNTESAQQSCAASEALTRLAEQLNSLVGQYRIH